MRKTLQRGWPWAALVLATVIAVSAAPRAAHTQSTTPKEGWLGVTTQEIDDDLREGIGYDGHGVLVSRVASNGPAGKAGVRSGDIIVSMNSKIVDTPRELSNEIRAAKPGQKITLRLVRDGKGMNQTVTLGDRADAESDEWDWEAPAPAPRAPRAPRAPHAPEVKTYKWHFDDDDLQGLEDLEDLPGFRTFQFNDGNGFTMLGRGRLGVRIEDLDGELGSYFNVPGNAGALVVEVLDDTPAAKAGLKAGDVITRVGDETVKDTNDLQRAVRDAEGPTSLTVVRKGASRTLSVDLGEAPRVMRMHRSGPGDRVVIRGNRDELRRELEELREELRELRRELEEGDRNR
jgi:membrane-associated protease RseP (regulator of RpoE activity)